MQKRIEIEQAVAEKIKEFYEDAIPEEDKGEDM